MSFTYKNWKDLFKGTYASGTAYTIGDIVNYNGSSYSCILNSTGNVPTDTTYWSLLAQKGDTGDNATVDVGTTTTLAAGESATVTNTGTTSDAVFNFGIPQGIKGDNGACVESVTFVGNDMVFTLEDGTTITLTDAKLDLKGDTGETGASITSAEFVGDDLVFTKDDNTTVTLVGAKTTLKGETGETGATGIDWQGAWSAGTYTVTQAVTHNGSSWIATTTTTEEPSISATDWDLIALKGTDGEGSGDVTGPTGATADAIALFNSTTGKLIKDSTKTIVTTLGADDTTVPTSKAVKDVTDGAVLKSTYNAHTILQATTDNTPSALEVTEQTVVGRATGGNITALAIDSDLSSVSANDDTIPSAKATKAMGDLKLPLAGGTMTGHIVLAENASVQNDPSLSADGKYTGITITGTAGATVAFGDLITLDKDDSRWELVDISVASSATGDARGLLGMAVSAGNDGDTITILLNGVIRADANFPTLTIGAPVYASTTGDVVVTQPSTTDYVIRIVGYGLTADSMAFNPAGVWSTHI